MRYSQGVIKYAIGQFPSLPISRELATSSTSICVCSAMAKRDSAARSSIFCKSKLTPLRTEDVGGNGGNEMDAGGVMSTSFVNIVDDKELAFETFIFCIL